MKNITSLNFWVHLTDNCNLTCDYCYISTLETQKSMSENTIHEFSNKLNQTILKYPDIETITLKLAGGEPLSKFNHWKHEIQLLINNLKKMKIKLNIRIVTNLTILNNEIITFCKINNITFAVSLDGLDEYHNKYRKFKNKDGSYKIIENNLLKLKNREVLYAILVTISNDNIEGILDLVEYLLDNNITFRLADAKGVNIDKVKLLEVLDNCYRLMKNYNNFDIKYKHLLCDLNFIQPSETPCSMGVTGGAIYINGDIYFCHSQFGSNQSLGNIFETNDLLSVIQKGYKFHNLSDECQECEFKNICAGGCPLYRTKENKSPMCEIFKSTIPKIQKLHKE